MTLAAFFEKEGIDPATIDTVEEFAGGVRNFRGPSGQFATFLRTKSVAAGDVFDSCVVHTLQWDAPLWHSAARSPVAGFVVVYDRFDPGRPPYPRWPTGWAEFGRGGGHVSETHRNLWTKALPHRGILAEIDRKYSASYGVVHFQKRDNFRITKFTVMVSDAKAWTGAVRAFLSQPLPSGEATPHNFPTDPNLEVEWFDALKKEETTQRFDSFGNSRPLPFKIRSDNQQVEVSFWSNQ